MKNNKNVFVTKHGYERAKERQHYNKEQTEKAVLNAIKKGKCAEDFNSRDKAFLDKVSERNSKAYVYNGFCYIIANNNICITTYKLPVWFGKKEHFVGKSKIKNPKKYFSKYENCQY